MHSDMAVILKIIISYEMYHKFVISLIRIYQVNIAKHCDAHENSFQFFSKAFDTNECGFVRSNTL